MPRGLLTQKQLLVLALASRGLRTSQIAEALGVTRQDVSTAIRRARRNLDKALRTIEEYAAATSPAIVRAEPGTDLVAVAEALIREADRAGLRLPLGRAELVIYLRAVLHDALAAGKLAETTCLALGPGNLPLRVSCSLADELKKLTETLVGGRG